MTRETSMANKPTWHEEFDKEFFYDCDGSGCLHSIIPHEGKDGEDDWTLQDKIKSFVSQVEKDTISKEADKWEKMCQHMMKEERQRIVEMVERMRRKGNPEFETNQDFGFNEALEEVIKFISK